MRKFSLIVLCCLIVACGASPKVDNYILYVHQTEGMKALDANSPKVYLKPLIFPAYLDRPQMVIRKDKVKLEIQEFKRWAEPLNISFLRVFKQGMLEHGVEVTSNKQFRRENFDYQLSLEVIHFEVNGAQKADLFVKWVLLNSSNDQVIASHLEILEVEISGVDFAEKVSAQSRAVVLLCARLAAQIYDKQNQIKLG